MPGGEGGGERRMPREILTVSFIGFVVTLGFGVIGPSLPALGIEFGAGTTLMSLAISGFAVARLVTNLGFTVFLGGVRLRTVLWVGLIFQAGCSVVAAAATDYTGFIVFRSLSGAGSAAFTIASSALLLALAPSHARGRAMSVFAGATALGTVSGPAVGGLFAVVDPRLPLLVYGGALAVASLAALVLLRSARHITAARAVVAPESALAGGAAERASAAAGSRLLGALAADRLFVAAVMCQVVGGWVFYGMRTTTVPLQLAGIGYAVGLIGLLLSAGAVAQLIGSGAAGVLSDHSGRVRPLVAALALAAVGLALLGATGDVTVVLVAFVLLGLAGGAVASVGTALLGDSRFGRSGRGVGIFWVASDIAAIFGPLVSGLVAEHAGFGAAYAVAIAIVLFALAVVARARRADGWSRRRGGLEPGAPGRPELG
ncbi:putative MFS family arabinose efflux permease [Microbacterium sp. AG790]|uniref:MFS transporter n=1 Tax=Microbacterium sp. AG790 TaxID=2183995 RepID=UPI000EAC58A1|nr:MFS transporter [Microbacterium sp. AG790]RKS86739.1 putative MFS family arabinose efflux permease [Microbacterium sp. AG790]